MRIETTIKETRAFLEDQKSKGKSIGFVPTMGALHQGHLDLMIRARKENDIVAVSIFVNPIQFNNKADLQKYPRDIQLDIDKLKTVPVDFLFNPEVKEMYPDEIQERYDFGALETVMEGKFRPGHFNGVAVVVNRLFNIINPDKAYFGEKDFQQLRVIEELVKQNNLPVKIIPCQTIREKDGLAMSSRNMRLTPEERQKAPFLQKVLEETKEKLFSMPVKTLLNEATAKIEKDGSFKLEYFEIVNADTLQAVDECNKNGKYAICLAAHLGNVRLIDNVIIR